MSEKEKNRNESKSQGGVLILLSMLCGLLLGLMLKPDGDARKTMPSKLEQAVRLVGSNYVDPMDSDSLADRMIELLALSLDPHSHYASAEKVRRDKPSMEGSFDGIGVLLIQIGDTVCALHVTPGSPADLAGVLPGDRLMRADTTNLVGRPVDEVISFLRGKHLSPVTLTIKRFDAEGQRYVRMRRNKVATPSVLYAGMLDKQRGYIILQRFCETSAEEFRTAVIELKSKGMKHLILDLRDNGGGLLDAAIDIADELLPNKELILYSEGEHQRRESYHSTKGGLWAEGKLTVMVNEYSASASEIIAGTIQDNDRGLIVGRRTFGKGLVQRQFYLKDGSCLFLTTARYYTPSGRCIQRPYDKGNDEYYIDFLRQLAVNYGGDTTLLHSTDTARYFTSSGRIVYGGGGILPDKAIKLFSDSLLVYYNELSHADLFRHTAFNYVSHHLQQLRTDYPTSEDFERRYDTPLAMLDSVVAQGQRKGIQPNKRTLDRYGYEMRQRIKAYIAESLYGTDSYYRIMLPYDTELQQVKKLK